MINQNANCYLCPMSLNLSVKIDPQSGFCFGVVKAIQRAEEILQQNGKLYCLGQIVHNDEEIKRLEKMGMITISHEEALGLKGQKILIRAHGEVPETYDMLRERGNEVIDATCPIVLKLQKRVKESQNEGETILIFGKANHAEVVGLLGHLNGKGVVFEHFDDLDLKSLPKSVTLYSQTTRSIKELYRVKDLLIEAGLQVKLKDTICRQVSGREDAMGEFCASNDVIVFVAGKNSSNGRVLFEGCKKKNQQSYIISSPDEIESAWFKTGDSVGICGATSTPTWLMEDVRKYLRAL